MLKEVGQRISGALRDMDVVSRLGGDEFVVALLDIGLSEDAGSVAQKILDALAEPFFVENHELLLSASIGISIFPDDGRDARSEERRVGKECRL